MSRGRHQRASFDTTGQVEMTVVGGPMLQMFMSEGRHDLKPKWQKVEVTDNHCNAQNVPVNPESV